MLEGKGVATAFWIKDKVSFSERWDEMDPEPVKFPIVTVNKDLHFQSMFSLRLGDYRHLCHFMAQIVANKKQITHISDSMPSITEIPHT